MHNHTAHQLIEWVDRPDEDHIIYHCYDERSKSNPIGSEIEVYDFGVPTKVKVQDIARGVDSRGEPIYKVTLKKI